MSEHLSSLIIKDAFISYGRKESTDLAKRLQKRFKKESMYAWFDATDIPAAVDWQQRIYKGIDEAHNFIFIISPYSVNSKYCFKEIKYAVKRNKRIIPLLHIKPSDNEVKVTHPIISEINWIPFQDNQDDFESSFKVLLNAMQKEGDYVLMHTDVLLKAKHWEDNGYQNSHLLHSQEREKAEEWLKKKYKPEEGVCNASDLHAQYICESTKHSNNFMTDVFFHSIYSEGISDYLKRVLHIEGITTWKMDASTGGTNKMDAVRRGVQRTATVLYFISPEEMKSEVRQIELLRAIDFRKRIIPVLIAPTNESAIPVELKHLATFDHSDTRSDALETEISNLVRTLKDEKDYYRLHRNFLIQAIKWKEQDENQSTLLQGARLQEAEDWLNHARNRKICPATTLHHEYIKTSLKRGYDFNSEIFICYSRVDSDFVRRLNEELQIMGRTTWIDTESIAPGRDFETEIRNGIENSDNTLLIISPDSVTSENCLSEITYAKKLNKRFINILLRDLEEDPLPKEVEKIQWIDFRKHHRDFHKPLSELMRSVNNQRDHVREHTIWLKAAQKWDQSERDLDRLLKGADYHDAKAWLDSTTKNKTIQQPTPLIKEFINASHDAIQFSKSRKARSRRFLISTLIMVTILLVISIFLGFYSLRQNFKLQEYNNTIELQKAELLQQTAILEKTISDVNTAKKLLEAQKADILRLQQQRDSTVKQATTIAEKEQAQQMFNAEILEKKEQAEKERSKAIRREKMAQVQLKKLKQTQAQQSKFQKQKVTEQEEVILDVPLFDGRGKDYKGGKWGFIDKSGTLVISHQFDQADDFNNGIALVYKDQKQAFIDKAGKPKSEWLDEIEPFENGLAEVTLNKKKSFLNTDGKVITKWFEDVYPFREGLAKVKLNNKWGYINTAGKIVIFPIFDKAFRFRKGKAKVERNGVKYYINKKGKRVSTSRNWGGSS